MFVSPLSVVPSAFRRSNLRCSAPSLSLPAIVLWFLASAAAAKTEAQPVIFVTSHSGPSDLSQWPQAGVNTGLEAADAICRTHAEEAGLANPEGFIAWMSDAIDDAACRIRGLTGSFVGNCGVEALPPVGPWVRTDGQPWGEIESMLGSTPRIRRPNFLDETGALNLRLPITGTVNWGGHQVDRDCGGWTETDGLAMGGKPGGTGQFWHSSSSFSCSAAAVLICMEARAGADLPDETFVSRAAFSTEAAGPGDITSWPEVTEAVANGIEAADFICQTEAASASLDQPSSFKAWLSTSTQSAASRFAHDGPWERVDGVLVANGLEDLTSSMLDGTLELTANGDLQQNLSFGFTLAWTGTTAAGALDANCLDWSSSSAEHTGLFGSAQSPFDWSQFLGPFPCNSDRVLYCFSDAALIPLFADGFESGTTGAWE